METKKLNFERSRKEFEKNIDSIPEEVLTPDERESLKKSIEGKFTGPMSLEDSIKLIERIRKEKKL